MHSLSQFFSDLASKYPERNALMFPDGVNVSYAELNELSNKIANFLISKGVKRQDVVAILNDKTKVSYALMIACVKIGAIYTNLDPKSPIERLARMMSIASPSLIFYFDTISDETKTVCESNAKSWNYSNDDFLKLIETYDSRLDTNGLNIPGNVPAYIMFTSGSTGFPKGVVISHQNVLNFIEWSKSVYETTVNDVFTNINPMHFDNSVFDFYASLFTGASMIPITEELTRNPRKLIEGLNKVEPTIWFSVPSMLVFALNMRAIRESDLPTLRVVTFGGEGFPKNQLRKLWALWGGRVRFVNVYGPTECTCICSSYDVTESDMRTDELLPLGFMAPNFYGLVMNPEGIQQDFDEIGELYIGGPNLGIGYYNNLEKTKEVFISNPLNNKFEETVYKSGDLVQLDSKTNMFVFAGRKDNQIKRMGYRIELEEIENAFNSIESIKECAVVFMDNEKYASKIIACLNTEEQEDAEIIKVLKNYLPSYMLPDMFFYYASLPKNQNGKIDRLKLKEELSK